MKRRNWLLLFAASAIFLSFQNCTGGFMSFSSNAGGIDASSTALPFSHPNVDVSTAGPVATGHLVLGDREYLESVFRDIFMSSESNASTNNYLETVMYQEFASVQQALGRSCDPYQEGSGHNCYYLISNVDTTMSASSSSIREAARIQVCRRLLGNDQMLNIVVDKIKGNQSTPNSDSIQAAIRLFFPASDNAQSLQATFLNLDQTMAEQSEAVSSRWRMILLPLCESPNWEVL